MKYNELATGLEFVKNMLSFRGYSLGDVDIKIMNFQDGCNGILKQRVEGTIKLPDGSILAVGFTPTYKLQK